ncbi:MAG: hypothetical protein QXM96_01685 [Candidatus Woesearchaeota archaeon]
MFSLDEGKKYIEFLKTLLNPNGILLIDFPDLAKKGLFETKIGTYKDEGIKEVPFIFYQRIY